VGAVVQVPFILNVHNALRPLCRHDDVEKPLRGVYTVGSTTIVVVLIASIGLQVDLFAIKRTPQLGSLDSVVEFARVGNSERLSSVIITVDFGLWIDVGFSQPIVFARAVHDLLQLEAIIRGMHSPHYLWLFGYRVQGQLRGGIVEAVLLAMSELLGDQAEVGVHGAVLAVKKPDVGVIIGFHLT